MVDQACGHGKGHRELGSQRVARRFVFELGRQAVGADINTGNVCRRGQWAPAGDLVNRVQRAMVVAAARMQLEVVAHQVPLAAQPVDQPDGVKLFRNDLAQQRTQAIMLACEAALGQLQGQQAVAVAQAGVDIAHQTAFEHGLLGTGGGHRSADVQRLAHALGIQAGDAGACGRSAHRAPGAVRVHGAAQRRGGAQTRADFVARDQRRQKHRGRHGALLAQRQRCRYHMHRRVAAGKPVAFVHFQKSAGGAVDESGCLGAGTTAQSHQDSTGARCLACGQCTQLGFGRTGDHRAQGVGQDPADLLVHVAAQRFVSDARGKLAESV